MIGAGCRRGASPVELIALIARTLEENHIPPAAIGAVASIDGKAGEPAIHAAAAHFGVPARFFSAAELNRHAGRVAAPSERVRERMGTPSVAEAAALAMAGEGAVLIAPRTKSGGATCALAAVSET